jgi:hypothetical protein
MTTRRHWMNFHVAFLLVLGVFMATSMRASAEDVTPSATTMQPNAAAAISPAEELIYWNRIKESGQPKDFLDYLNLFPDGMFFDPAKSRYEQLSGQQFVPKAGLVGETTTPLDKVVVPDAKQKITKVKVQAAKNITRKNTKSIKITGLTKKKFKLTVFTRSKKLNFAAKKKTCSQGVQLASYKTGCSIAVNWKHAPKKISTKRNVEDGSHGNSGGGGGGSSGGGWGG